MAEKTRDMNSFFNKKEKDFYNRFYKKIYIGRILKAADKKYALEEYSKSFIFETEFALINKYYEAFTSFFEEHEKLGHSMDAALRLMKKGDLAAIFNLNHDYEVDSVSSSQTDIKLKNKAKKAKTIVSPQKEDVISSEKFYRQHFSKLEPEELISEYATWKAKKRFVVFLQSELLQLETSENSVTDTVVPEASLNKTSVQETSVTPIPNNKENTARRQTLAIYYLDLHFKINKSGKEIALSRFIHFLSNKNIDNIQDALRNPLKMSEKKRIKADEELLKDLKYVRVRFDDLKLAAIVQKIDTDIETVSREMQ